MEGDWDTENTENTAPATPNNKTVTRRAFQAVSSVFSVSHPPPSGFAKIGDGLVAVALVAPCEPAVAVRRCVFRIEPDSFVKVGQGFVVVCFVPPRVATVVVPIGILRVEPNGFAKVGNSLVVVLF